jgi:hypothetical protein
MKGDLAAFHPIHPKAAVKGGKLPIMGPRHGQK